MPQWMKSPKRSWVNQAVSPVVGAISGSVPALIGPLPPSLDPAAAAPPGDVGRACVDRPGCRRYDSAHSEYWIHSLPASTGRVVPFRRGQMATTATRPPAATDGIAAEIFDFLW